MKKLPKKLTNRLRRKPAELLEVTRHFYQSQIDREVVAAFPVVLRQSIETVFAKLLPLVAVVALVAWIATSINPQFGGLFVICAAGAALLAKPSDKYRFGIVAVTATHFVLIELCEASLENGQVTEQIDRPKRLPPANPAARGRGVHPDALPFAEEGSKGWRYAILCDHKNDYLSLFEELGESKSVAKELANV